MRFVKFTRNDGVPILINLDKVDGCTPENERETRLCLGGAIENSPIVKATLGEILHGAYREDPEIPRRPEQGVREPLVVNEAGFLKG